MMKKFTPYIFTMIVLTGFLITGQENNIKFGVKAGANFSKYSGTLIASDYRRKLGFYAGGFANIMITEKFKIQPELLFALQGSNFVIKDIEIRENQSDIARAGDFKTKTTESTISIPLLARYYASKSFYLESGPQLGLIINREEKVIESPTDNPDFNQVTDFDNDIFDLGLAIGAGYALSNHFTLNSRYFLGLIERDINNVKSSVFNLGIEYDF